MKLGQRRPWTRGTCWRQVATRAASVGATALCVAPLALVPGCVGAESQRLSCDDVYDASQVSFNQIVNLVTRDELKSCGGLRCHNRETQQNGLRLDTPELIYDEMSSRPEVFYAYLASGEMPQASGGGEPWSEEDLKVFRSWYCGGAFPP